MNIRRKKLAGVLGTVAFLILYSLAAMAAGGQFIVGLGKTVELGYYIIMGVAWIPAVMAIIHWMSVDSALTEVL